MTFITARDLRLKAGDLWEQLEKNENIIVTLNGKPCAIITGVSPDTLEESLYILKRLRAEAAVTKMRQNASKKKLHKASLSEINKEIKAARKGAR